MRKMLVLVMVIGLFTLSACSGMDQGYKDYEPYATEYYQEGETYAEIVENKFIRTEDMPVSTFSTDVDTASIFLMTIFGL